MRHLIRLLTVVAAIAVMGPTATLSAHGTTTDEAPTRAGSTERSPEGGENATKCHLEKAGYDSVTFRGPNFREPYGKIYAGYNYKSCGNNVPGQPYSDNVCEHAGDYWSPIILPNGVETWAPVYCVG